MIKRPFFGFTRPKLTYADIALFGQAEVRDIPLPKKVTLFVYDDHVQLKDLGLRQGREVNTGETIPFTGGRKGHLMTTAAGTVGAVFEDSTYTDYRSICVSLDVDERDKWDPGFTDAAESPSAQVVREFLPCLPGIGNVDAILDIKNPVHTLIINGIDQDLLISTQQLILNTEAQGIKEGISYLKDMTGAARIILVIPPSLRSAAEKTGAEVKVIDPIYPKALPWFTVRDLLDQDIPVTIPLAHLGVGVLNVEAVLAFKTAFVDRRPPVEKVISVIQKDGRVSLVRARIGTSLKDILTELRLSTEQEDRIVFGGPMTGHSVYSEKMPVMHTTDAIFLQDKDEVVPASDSPCVNCGECVRACPARLPVNMLVRLLENRLYEEAAQRYDLLSCVECGLCSYVCMLHIPVFQYIMLGKHELALQRAAEESDGE